jgi:superfamily I DNA/RNA helicase
MPDIHKKAKVIGPAGCGKTTYLLGLIEKAAKKYEPDRIGAVSLTNAAIEEMREMVWKQTGLPHKAAKNIRTIHSTCFNLLELRKEQVADKKIRDFNEAYPEWSMPFNIEITEDEHHDKYKEGHSPEENKKRFNQIQVLRHRMIPPDDWPNQSLVDMYRAWDRWMFENGLIDFTRMLEKAYSEELCPEIDILLVDEAQDISKLSMSLLEMWARNTVSTVYVGDSDQAILRFAGAVPEVFINLDHSWMKVLGKTYRVPRKVHELAMRIIRQAKNREDIDYEPTEIEGEVIRVTEPDLSLPGTHMILGRCQYHLNRWRNYLIDQGVAFHNPYRPGDKTWNPLNTKLWRAAKAYTNLRDGKEISRKDALQMVKELISDGNLVRGAKTNLDEIITDERLDLFTLPTYGIFTESFLTFEKPMDQLFRLRGQSGKVMESVKDILKEPNVIIGTIHSVKGGEADHVWIDTSTSPQCLYAMKRDATIFWDEVRVGYVAVTRARKTVGLMGWHGIRNQVFRGE